MRKIIIIMVILFLLVFCFVYSQPPFAEEQATLTEGLVVSTPHLNYAPLNTSMEIHFHVYNLSNGVLMNDTLVYCEACLFDLNGTEIIEGQKAEPDGDHFYLYFSDNNITRAGVYAWELHCQANNSKLGGYTVGYIEGTTDGKAPAERNTTLLGFVLLIPLVVGIIFLVGAATLSEDHTPLRIFLFLLSIVTFFISLHWSALVVIKFFSFDSLINAFGSTTWWIGVSLFIIIAYFVIYLFYKLVHASAQKKEEKLNY